ncbi:MAG: hypothetical protein GY757_42230 [bacterium]|nr:hypothetical protein [bacterium]
MDYVLEERIGNPELFTGRKEELAFFLNWIDNIKEKKSQSTALLARRKMGKTALMERLFNITFAKNDGVIPFYYEIKERDMFIVDFCIDFCLTFVYQYIAFKSRKAEYIATYATGNLTRAKQSALKEGLDYLVELIDEVEYLVKNNRIDILWETVRQAPKNVAFRQKEYIVQMIDEFQFLNAKIYLDIGRKTPANTLAGGYLSTAESKVAPLLISGSWVGWLMNELITMLPSRFRFHYPGNMPEDEAVEMIYNYSRFFDVPVTDETVYLLAKMAEGSPFYISSIIRSSLPDKDLTTIKGLTAALEFETLDNQGVIKLTWLEYVAAAFPQINDRNAKNIVLHLCKNRDRELTRKELLRDLKLDMSDHQLEKKLKALIKADIILQGQTNFDYRGVTDNIFDKVFRGVYEKEIRHFDVKTIKEEYGAELLKQKKMYKTLQGRFNYQKGLFHEYLLLEQLRLHSRANNKMLKSITRYLPADFNFCDYSRVWRYDSSPEYAKGFNVDIFARAKKPGDYSLIGEVKSRDTRKFSKEEVMEFERKFDAVKKLEKIDRVVGFIFSSAGFTSEADKYCKEKSIACSHHQGWLGV